MPDVVIWGRVPPPLGGVTRCVEGLSHALDEERVDHVVVDWRQFASIRIVVGSRSALHVHNVSSVFRLLFVMAARAVSGAESIVYFHSGTLGSQLQSPIRRAIASWCLRRVDAIWTTNEDLVRLIGDTADVSAIVVSPFSKSLEPGAIDSRHPETAVVFVGYGKSLYGLDAVIEAGRSEALANWTFTVVAYGDESSCAAVREKAEAAGFRVFVNLDADQVAGVLAENMVLLRPTTADGDSMVVREALAAGMRVVASDVVVRPSGVEVYEPNRGGLADALVRGGRLSDGVGLGPSISEKVLAETHLRAGKLRRR